MPQKKKSIHLPPLGTGSIGVQARDRISTLQLLDDLNVNTIFTGLTQSIILHQPKNALRFMYEELGRMIEEEDVFRAARSSEFDRAAIDSCLLRMRCEYEGPDGRRKISFTRLVPLVETMQRYRAEQQAVQDMHSVFWGPAEEQASSQETAVASSSSADGLVTTRFLQDVANAGTSTQQPQTREQLEAEVQSLKAQLAEATSNGDGKNEAVFCRRPWRLVDTPNSSIASTSDLTYISPEDSDAIHTVLLSIVADPECFFGLGAAENLEDLTIAEFGRACEASVKASAKGISQDSVQRLFRQLDKNNNNKISMDELFQISEIYRLFYKESNCESVMLAALIGLVHQIPSQRESSSTADRCREQPLMDLAELSEDLVRNVVVDKVITALVKHGKEVKESLKRNNKEGRQKEDQGAGKYFTASYGRVSDYDRGLDAIGTPHPNVLEHMKKEVTESPDSLKTFEAWNSGPNKTFPLKEWEFIYDPFTMVSKDKPPKWWPLRHQYGGQRSPIRLQVFMHVLSATPMSEKMGASLFDKDKSFFFGDYKKAHELPETDARWLHLHEVSMVKVVLLRHVKAQLDGVSLTNALSKHQVLRGKYTAEKANIKADRIVEALEKGLRKMDGPDSTCTFKFLVGGLKDIVTEEELEAIISHFHTKLAEAKVSEADLIGMRGYSGPLYVKMNGSLRQVGAHVKMVLSLPCALEQCTQDVKQTLKEVFAAVIQIVDPAVVSMDFFSESQAKTRIEIRVGVAPREDIADKVCKRMTMTIDQVCKRIDESVIKMLRMNESVINSLTEKPSKESKFPDNVSKAINTIAAVVGYNQLSASDGYNAFDADEDGQVSLSDLIQTAATKFRLDISEEDIRSLFESLDSGRKGYIPPEAWEQAMSSADTEDTLKSRGVSTVGVGMSEAEASTSLMTTVEASSPVKQVTDSPAAREIYVVEAAAVVGLCEHLKSNHYVNFVYACASGMSKISRVSRIPRGRRVYRGMGEIKLPTEFLNEKEGGGRGGVEYAFMSTTTRREVAVCYIGGKAFPILFECEVGDIDRGCSLSFLSQYPQEDEILIPPMSYLEVTGKPSVKETEKGSNVFMTVYPARINCNQKSQTIEEIQSRRKHDLLAMAFYIEQELHRDLTHVVEVMRETLSEAAAGWGRYLKFASGEFVVDTSNVSSSQRTEIVTGSKVSSSIDLIAGALMFNQLSASDGYDAFDADEDGKVSLVDLQSAAAQLQLAISEQDIRSLFESLDKGRTGYIPREAWVQTIGFGDGEDILKSRGLSTKVVGEWSQYSCLVKQDNPLKTRGVVDIEGMLPEDGKVSLSNLKMAAEKLQINLTAAQVHRLFNLLDVNKVGFVDANMSAQFLVSVVLDQRCKKFLDDFASKRKEWERTDAKEFNNDIKYLEDIGNTIHFKHNSIVELGKLVCKEDNLHKDNFVCVATEEGHGELSKTLISLGFAVTLPDNVNDQNSMGETLLATSCRLGRFEVVEKLLKAKADVNLVREDGTSALQLAIVSGKDRSFEMVEALLEAKADVNVINHDGVSALHMVDKVNILAYVACECVSVLSNTLCSLTDCISLARAHASTRRKSRSGCFKYLVFIYCKFSYYLLSSLCSNTNITGIMK
jgi:Ca2+-binding EF-hand superfamily protein